MGGGVGRIVRMGKLPVNLSLQGFYSVVEPNNVGPEWSVRSSSSPAACGRRARTADGRRADGNGWREFGDGTIDRSTAAVCGE